MQARAVSPRSLASIRGARLVHTRSAHARPAHARPAHARRQSSLCVRAQSTDDDIPPLAAPLAAASAIALPVVGWSEVTVFNTGCGLPPGPGGALGALEGVSYLVLVAMVGYSVVVKARTGAGLPAGPYGLIGAAEGVAFLLTLTGIGVAIAQQVK